MFTFSTVSAAATKYIYKELLSQLYLSGHFAMPRSASSDSERYCEQQPELPV